MTVTPFLLSLLISSQMTLLDLGSRPVVGSSRNRTSGSFTKLRPRSNLLFIPPEYVFTLLSADSVRSTSSRSSSVLSFDFSLDKPHKRPVVKNNSLPVSKASTPVSWRATPIFVLTSLSCFSTSNPMMLASPLVMPRSVVNIRIVVLFPAPFGPKILKISPFST